MLSGILSISFHYNIYASDFSETENNLDDINNTSPIDVFCPTDYPFLLFDNESGGRQLTSQVFHIANYGTEDVVVDLSDAWIEPSPEICYRELSQPVDCNYISDSKDVFAFLKVIDITSDEVMTADMLNTIDIPLEETIPQDSDYILTGIEKPDSYQIILKAANHTEKGEFVSFNPESIFSFYISGSTTPNKNLVWNHGDLSFHINIRLYVSSEEDSSEFLLPDDSSLSEIVMPDITESFSLLQEHNDYTPDSSHEEDYSSLPTKDSFSSAPEKEED